MHLDPGVLVAYRDRELSEEAERNVTRHLESCPRCARAEGQASSDWELCLAADAQFRSQCVPATRGLERLLSGIQEWKRSAAALPAEAEPSNLAEVRRRIGAQLELYFGSGAAAMLETAASSPRPIAAVEPLLTAFLGRKAAAAVIGQILNGVDGGFRLTAEAV